MKIHDKIYIIYIHMSISFFLCHGHMIKKFFLAMVILCGVKMRDPHI